MNIDLTSEERRLILISLLHKCIKMSIMEPATPRLVRDTYKNLIEKLKRDERLHMNLSLQEGKEVPCIPGKIFLP